MKNLASLLTILGILLPAVVSAADFDKDHWLNCQAFLNSSTTYLAPTSSGEPLPRHWNYLFGESKTYSRFTVDRVDSGAQIVSSGSREQWIEKSDRFKIDELMKDFKLTRFEAAEVQAQYRRMHKLITSDVEFLRIVNNVRAGHYMSGLDPKKLAHEKAVIALDIDGTILDQDRSSWKDGITTFSLKAKNKEQTIYVAMAPGWDHFLRRLLKLKVPIVLYSRNSDYRIHALADIITLDGKPLRHYVAGVLSGSYMVDTGLLAAASTEDQVENSHKFARKDRRLLGDSNIVFIDDEPIYIRTEDHLQVIRAREFDVRKMEKDAEDRYFAKRGKKPKDSRLPSLVQELMQEHANDFEIVASLIEDSVELVRKYPQVTMAHALLPYTYLMEDVVRKLLEEHRELDYEKIPKFKEYKDVRDWIRKNPKEAIALIGKENKKKAKTSTGMFGWFSSKDDIDKDDKD
ncbi:MAG: NIF family HAD-type phosphatase [Bdellovibrionales bacterium]